MVMRWVERFWAWRRATSDAQQLRAMSDRELTDLGLGRSEILVWLARESQAPKKYPQDGPAGIEVPTR